MKENLHNIYYIGNAPVEFIAEADEARRRFLTEKRKEILKKLNDHDFRYYCSACLIIRDENEYLEEWLKWHIGQGVEHFYIYDHGSKQPVREFLKTPDKDVADRVTVTEWKGRHTDAQPDAYNDCLKRRRGESRWIAFIDTDEQIRVKTGQTLPEFLKGYEEYAGLFAIWVTYGANGQVRQTDEPLRERFTEVSHGDEWAEKVGKLIAQPIYMSEAVIHNGKAEDGFIITDEHKRRIYDYALTTETPTRDLICVDHYYTKSLEEWMKKLHRGSAHAKFSRKYAEFFRINPEMEYCKEDKDISQKYEQFD